jgi:hypothetical protein
VGGDEPELVSVTGGHQWAFLAMTLLNGNIVSRHIIDFLEQRLYPHAPGPREAEAKDHRATNSAVTTATSQA